MDKLEVRIIQLEPMRVASTHGFGASPETLTWDKLTVWAKERGLWPGETPRRFFGFNNPDPSPGSPNYGYETWMTVGPEVEFGGRNYSQRVLRRLICSDPLCGEEPWRGHS